MKVKKNLNKKVEATINIDENNIVDLIKRKADEAVPVNKSAEKEASEVETDCRASGKETKKEGNDPAYIKEVAAKNGTDESVSRDTVDQEETSTEVSNTEEREDKTVSIVTTVQTQSDMSNNEDDTATKDVTALKTAAVKSIRKLKTPTQ